VNLIYHLRVQTFKKKTFKKQIYNASKAVKLTANAERTHFHIPLQKCRAKSYYKVANKYIKKW